MTIHIFGGGTVMHVRNHLALCAPAYGATARHLFEQLGKKRAKLHLTKMADYKSNVETNYDVECLLCEVLEDPATTAIVFNVALCDYIGAIGDIGASKYAARLSSRDGEQTMRLTPADKLLGRIKLARPDIFLVGFKTTADAGEMEQHRQALRQIEETSADLVFANDTVTRNNMLVSAKTGVSIGTRGEMLSELWYTLVKLGAPL